MRKNILNNSPFVINSIMGPTGPTGPAGIQGPGGSYTILPPISPIDANAIIINSGTSEINLEYCGVTGPGIVSLSDQIMGSGNKTFTNDVILNANLQLPNTSASNVGVITKNSLRFLHNYGTDSTFLGQESGNFTMTGNEITAIGSNTLNNNTTGNRMVAVGDFALNANTTGNQCTGIGTSSLLRNTTGSFNTAVGPFSLQNNTTGGNNTALGHSAGIDIVTGSFNVCIGVNSSTTNSNNTYCGYSSGGGSVNDGTNNCGYGYQSLRLNTGNNNLAAGYQSGKNLTSGSNNICILNFGNAAETNTIRIGTFGTQTRNFQAGIRGIAGDLTDGIPVFVTSTGQLTTAGSGTTYTAISPIAATDANGVVIDNTLNQIKLEIADATHPGIITISSQTFAGAKTFNGGVLSASLDTSSATALSIAPTTATSIDFNNKPTTSFWGGPSSTVISIGNNSGTTHGIHTVCIGPDSMYSNTGAQNTSLGSSCLLNNVDGLNNTGVGFFTMQGNVSGSNNTCMGGNSLNVLTGSNNCCLGANSANFLQNGSGNIFIGGNCGSNYTGSESDNIIIANNGVVGDNNIIRIGETQGKNYQAGIKFVNPAIDDGNLIMVSSEGQITDGNNGAKAARGQLYLTAPVGGYTPSLFNYYEEFSDTVTLTGPWAVNKTHTFTWIRIGTIVSMSWNSLPGPYTLTTSTTINVVGSPIQARFRNPSGQSRIYVIPIRNGTDPFAVSTGNLDVNEDVFTFFNLNESVFTDNAGFFGGTVTWTTI